MRKLAVIALALLASTSVHASQWNVAPLTSKLTFTGDQSGEKFEGSFPKFSSVIDFDESAPAKGSIAITVDMSKLQVDGKDRLDSLPTEDWFAVSKFPTATFISSTITATGSDKTGINNYLAKGNLTIRGISREVALPFSLKTEGVSTVARGTLTINRHDFGVGQGQWAKNEWIKFPVQLSYEIHATAK